MIENGPVVPAHFAFCRNEGGLGAARGLAYVAHVVDMKVGEFAEGSETRNERLAEASLPFSVYCLKSRMVAPKDCLSCALGVG